ncbi:Ni/Fe-hydrogenase, b-type cytochrome subunit [Ferrimonas lipolytica]|uniref:Ni/Fe-hydrogenase, b-type cytochrome subunit n=1 Tax=Ferrimonas lipolytica TaxID=2724191 RepID=A0A6H1UBL2_9GAMM|nr:Ni/Fe-hydrogenase, b-type cytochrome subunit [Ferrimonas lipolytica]QIZ76424.1 Ni/Fe-hydrogenase, b-type cytochrome subunit [Ferrimonas lipolytica]
MIPETDHLPHSRDYVFSPAIRIFHWLRALAIVVLVATGFYIAWPFLTPYGGSDNLQQGWFRMAHLIFGFVLCAITVIRAYLYFFSKSDIERRSWGDVISVDSWVKQLLSYVWVGKLHKKGIYGPLQYMTYLATTLVIVVMCVTGIALHSHVYHDGVGAFFMPFSEWVVVMFGGLAPVREIHHILTWVFVVFIVIHVYMAVWSGIRFRHNSVDSIISGYDYHPMKNDKDH